jgi:uncharacterized protein with PQ loop repeat
VPAVNELANAAGYIGAALSVGMVVPQLIRTLRHPRLGGVSAMSWLITAACCFTWLLYGIKGQVWPQIPGNALLVPGAAAIVLAVPARLSRAQRAGLLSATAGALILVTVLARADVLGYLAFALTLIAATPQVITSVRRHQAGRSAVSIPSWLMRGGSQVFWLCYGLIMHNGPTALSAVVVLVSVAIVIAIESAALISARLARRQAGPLPQAGGPHKFAKGRSDCFRCFAHTGTEVDRDCFRCRPWDPAPGR